MLTRKVQRSRKKEKHKYNIKKKKTSGPIKNKYKCNWT